MGSDFIAASLALPTRTAKTIIDTHVKRVLNILASDVVDLLALQDLGVEITNDADPPVIADLRQQLAEVSGITSAEDIAGRTGSYTSYTVNGVQVDFVFSGEHTWGDEPEVSAYRTIMILWATGTARALEEGIPWRTKKHSKNSTKNIC